jgi:flagellar hook-associated protein 2
MSGISSGTGIFSGINTQQLIDQLLAIEARPKALAQRRVIQLQQQQAAWLDLNSKVQALKTAAGAFRIDNIFKTNKAISSDESVLSATASITSTPGSYQFIVDRLVSTQQFLSRGFANAGTTGLNAGTFTFEPAAGRLDRDLSLADLNGGSGVARGKIVITDATNNQSATIDLTRAGTVQEVLDAINAAPGVNVKATVEGGKFVIKSNVGGNLSITNAFGSTTAASLGIERATASSSSITGSTVYSLSPGMSLAALNDGNGIALNSQTGNARFDFTITVGGTAVNVNIGTKYDGQGAVTESAPTTMGGVLTRINDALTAALGNNHAQAAIGSDGASLVINDTDGRSIEVAENTAASSHTAADLGIATTSPQIGSVLGRRILSGLNTTLVRTLNGGSGVSGDGTITVTGRDGIARVVTIDTNGSVQDILDAFNQHPSGKIAARLNRTGTGIEILDLTGGTGNFIVAGDSATSLGIATDPGGVASSTVTGTNAQHQYITSGTLLASLRAGQGVGTGKFRITDSQGATALVTVDENAKTLDDVIRNINSRGTRIRARINDKGDGLLLYEDATGAGAAKITVADDTGTVAANLNIAGEAPAVGAENTIDGTAERKVTFAATDTLQQIATKISAAGVGVTAAILNDGAGSTPFRLSLTAKNSGSAGRFIVDTGAFDLGATELDHGQDARVFYGSSDPAHAVLLTSSRNTLDSVIPGVSIDLKSVSDHPVTLAVSRDTEAVTTAVQTFISAFNTLVDRIDEQTRYVQETDTKGPLLGDSTALSLRGGLFTTIQATGRGISGQFDRLVEVGIKIGEGGKLSLDENRFRQALEQDPQGVADLFAARVQAPNTPGTLPNIPGVTFNNPDAPANYTSLGVASQMELFADSMINSVNGALTNRNKTIDDQIEDQNKRIADFDTRLATRRQILEQQFLAMEEAIGRLQQQQGSLSQIGQLG